MRHRVSGRKLGRTSAHRLALYRNLVTSLLEHERIQTTDAKAKEVRRVAERMITLGKRGDLHARRRALRVIRRREVAAKVFDDLAVRYRDRPGGYTRVLRVRNRVGDAALLSIVELVEGAAPEKGAGKVAKAEKKKDAPKQTAKKKTTRKAAARKTEKAAAKGERKKTARKKAGSEKKASTKKTAKKKTSAATSKKTAKKTARKKSGARKSDS